MPYYDALITRYDQAIRDDNHDGAQSIVEESVQLAVRLNNGSLLGIKGGEESPCYLLERSTASPSGVVPRWGQTGDFTVSVRDCQVRIKFSGLYGICIPQFGEHATTDYNKPFISETGYRSFMAHKIIGSTANLTVDDYVTTVLQNYITTELKNKILTIQHQYGTEGKP